MFTSTGRKDTHELEREWTDASGKGIRLIRRLVGINLGLAGLQALSAGLFLSGYGYAISLHVAGAVGLLLGALVQAVSTVILARRRRVPAWVRGVSLGLFVLVFAQFGLGYNKVFWLHVPLGVGIFGGLMRQATMLDGWRRRQEGSLHPIARAV